MSNFEDFLRDNRSELDLPEVNPEVWQNIQGKVKGKRVRIRVFSRVAAIAAAVALLIGVFQWGRHSSTLVIPQAMADEFQLPSTGIDALIAKQVQQIEAKSIPVSYRDDLQLLLQQVQYLDDNYEQQRAALATGSYEESTLREGLRYYRTKVDLLNRIIEEIEKINQYEKDNLSEQRVSLRL